MWILAFAMRYELNGFQYMPWFKMEAYIDLYDTRWCKDTTCKCIILEQSSKIIFGYLFGKW